MASSSLRSCFKKRNSPFISSASSSPMSIYKQQFHYVHGRNVELVADGTIARRVAGFANSSLFSGRPIRPGEVFLIEITEVEPGLRGNIRVGFTNHNPENMTSYFLTTLDALRMDEGSKLWIKPAFKEVKSRHHTDLVKGSKSWMKPAFKEMNSRHHTDDDDTDTVLDILSRSRQRVVVDELEAREVRAVAERMERTTLAGLEALGPIVVERMQSNYSVYEKSAESMRCECRWCVGDTTRCGRAPGSRIGVVYFVSEGTFTMRLIINGDDQGPIEPPMPLPEAPLYAVVDVYGGTKEVVIIESSDFVPRLMDACKSCILANFTAEQIMASGLPKRLKEFLIGYQERF